MTTVDPDTLERDPRVLRPSNYPRETPGRGAAVVESKGGVPVGVVNVLGRVFMTPVPHFRRDHASAVKAR